MTSQGEECSHVIDGPYLAYGCIWHIKKLSPWNIQLELLSPWNIRIIVIIPYRSKKNPQKTSRIQRNSHHWWLSTIDAWCHMVRHMPLVVMMVMVWRTLITGHAAPGHGLSPHHHVCLPSPGRTYQTYHHHSYSTPQKMPTWRIWRIWRKHHLYGWYYSGNQTLLGNTSFTSMIFRAINLHLWVRFNCHVWFAKGSWCSKPNDKPSIGGMFTTLLHQQTGGCFGILLRIYQDPITMMIICIYIYIYVLTHAPNLLHVYCFEEEFRLRRLRNWNSSTTP